MTASISNHLSKPCLVQTAQGFTVSYQGKFLYSKYNPSKAILQYIDNLTILPQSIILCVSPLLDYGLKELSQKLPQDCIMLGCEIEEELKNLIKHDNINHYTTLTKEELLELGPLLTKKNVVLKSGFKLPLPGTFRRIIRIDFSAASQFNTDFYNIVIENSTQAIMTFWANRVTLVKFGRKYCSNFFSNLSIAGKTVPITNYFGKFNKAIYVFGAGESAQEGIKVVKKQNPSEYFILCADTALQPLLAQNIIPDGVFIEEAQNVISKCFIGSQNCGTHIFAGLSSIHSLTRFFKPEEISFFTTEFLQADFLDKADEAGILPNKNPAFGSVGITTYYYACLFKKDDTIPIYTYGLDFAYSAGRTHTKGAMADNARFMASNRIKNDANYSAAFCQPAFKIEARGHAGLVSASMYTTPIMSRYNEIMTALRQAQEPQMQVRGTDKTEGVPEPAEGQKIKQYLKKEKESLQEIKALLTGEKVLPAEELKNRLTSLISPREYLYLHFPDGHKFQYTQSFLNRVRVEVDYFLKVIS